MKKIRDLPIVITVRGEPSREALFRAYDYLDKRGLMQEVEELAEGYEPATSSETETGFTR